MQVQSVNSQNFMGLKCYPNYSEVQYVLAKKLNGSGFDKAVKYLSKLAKNRAHTDVYVAGGYLQAPKIYAEVGDKLYKENFFNNSIRVLKRALKKSNRFDEMHNEEVIAKIMGG